MAEPYRIMLVGSREDLDRLSPPLAAGPGRFELALNEPDREGRLGAGFAAGAPDVAVIGATVERPLPLAQQVRTSSPKSQILFLLPPEQVERFRARLPFVPHLASSWTASMAADASALAGLIGDAARAAREREASHIVFGRINQQLAARSSAPAQARRSQLALSERYLATILTQSPDAFLAVDRGGLVIAHNDAAERLFGPAIEQAYRTGAEGLFRESERAKLIEALRRAGRGETLSGLEVSLGEEPRTYAELALAPVQDESGATASVSITARDVTERRRADERQRLLINELNHRVKNTLAIVQALAQQSFKGDSDPEEERGAFAARLQALAAAHNLLTRQSWQPISLAHVVEATIAAASGPATQRFEIAGTPLQLPAQTAVSLAMALHELTTNAIKYGALSNEAGRVSVVWRVEERAGQPRLRLEWIEAGGPPVEPPAKRGFGSRMIERGLAAELNGEVRLDFRTGGVACLIDAPLPGSNDPTFAANAS